MSLARRPSKFHGVAIARQQIAMAMAMAMAAQDRSRTLERCTAVGGLVGFERLLLRGSGRDYVGSVLEGYMYCFVVQI
jgi:hypothetical protein